MSFKSFVTTGVAAGATVSALAVAPAAYAGSFSIGGLTSDSGFIQFDKNTRVQFDFLESRGFFKSAFGIYDQDGNLVETLFTEQKRFDSGSSDAKNDWLGTCPETVPVCKAVFEFQAGVQYQFGLTPEPTLSGDHGDSIDADGLTIDAGGYSVGADPNFAIVSNADGYIRSTVGPAAIAGGADPQDELLDTSSFDFFVAINDSDAIDGDIQDFIVGAKAVPEPATLLGIMVVGGLGFFGRRRQGQAEA
jgi:hypothetical protein